MSKLDKEAINKFLETSIMADQPIVLGLSGGPDSMLLYRLLSNFRIQKNYTDTNLIIVSLDHAVRSESREEINTLQELCHRYTFITDRFNGNSKSERVLRQRRHQIFVDVCNHYKSKFLLLGHNLTERAETFLLNLRRGVSLEGMKSMAGIQEHRIDKNIQVLRPLINITKADIMKLIEEEGIKYFTDKTNTDSSVSQRNFLRNNVMPWLLKDGVKETKFLSSLGVFFEHIDNLPVSSLDFVVHEVPNHRGADFWYEGSFDRSTLTAEQLSTILKSIKANAGLTSRSLQDLLVFLKDNQSGYKYRNGIYFFVAHEVVHLIKAPKEFRKIEPYITAYALTEQDIRGGSVLRANQDLQLPSTATTGDTIRFGKSGDQIKGKRRSQYCINQKIPMFLRKIVPVLEKDNKIHYVWNIAL